MDYYVYQYERQNGIPYYIGKGKGDRAYKKNNTQHRIYVPKDLKRVKIVSKGLTEEQAFELEKKLILKYGREDLNTGVLLNRSPGGEGGNTHTTPHNEEAKLKISNKLKGIKRSYITKNKMSKVAKKRVGEKNGFFGRQHSEETRQRLREAALRQHGKL